MAGKGQTAFVATMIAGLVAAASLAGAQPIPLPPPNPFPRSGNVPPPPPGATPGRPGQPATPPPAASGPSWLPPFLGGSPQQPAARAPATAAAFDERQRALVNRVSVYLSSVHVLSGDFIQIGADGRRAKGAFYIQKPGRVRFEYEPPSPIDIIANGRDVVVRDRRLATQDLYPLSQTPLRFLLSDKIDLLRDTNVVAIYADTAFVTVVVEEKQVLLGTSRLMMMFDSKDYQLKQWVITDPQGFDTTVAVSNLDSKRRPDPALFTIDYTDYSRER
jgi:outer membrane lipoprotein-sorting protein